MVLRIILMVLLVVVLVIAALVVLLTLFPLRFTFEYKEPGLLIQLRVGPLRFALLRRETEEQKRERERKKAEKKAKKHRRKPPEPSKPTDKKARRKNLFKFVLKALEEFTRGGKIPLDKLWLDVTFGGEDPAAAAMLFGWGNAGIGALWPLAEHYFSVRDRRIRTAVDFNLPATRVDYFCVVLPLPLAKGIGIAVRLLIWMISEHRSGKKSDQEQINSEQKEAV